MSEPAAELDPEPAAAVLVMGSWIGEVPHPGNFDLDQCKVRYGRTPTSSRSSEPGRIMHLIHHLVLMAPLLASIQHM
jgi:hypothetical protein